MDDDSQNRTRLFVAQRPNLFRDHFHPIDRQTPAHAFQRLRRREAIEDRLILFFQLELWVRDAIQQFSVVGQEQESRGLTIEPTNRHDALRNVDEFENGTTATFVRGGRDVACGFVEHDVAAALPLDHVTVNSNHLTLGIDSHPKFLDDIAINADASIDNHLLSFSSRRQPIRRNHTLKTFQNELP